MITPRFESRKLSLSKRYNETDDHQQAKGKNHAHTRARTHVYTAGCEPTRNRGSVIRGYRTTDGNGTNDRTVRGAGYFYGLNATRTRGFLEARDTPAVAASREATSAAN